ncbi:OprO/OprP family phosphate-selective porin [Corallococcus aberystwythensis]|uniref:Porin n=1 Tax=Corallococcus aberystwythensis TaxID=2316722 RepID=A0A3A8P6D9_9BACT|nr:porin [Corallococcus aberystwythensis]RKH52086.1 hypothetical protein D7W81_40100 [Corallococcus aberystwythensis]
MKFHKDNHADVVRGMNELRRPGPLFLSVFVAVLLLPPGARADTPAPGGVTVLQGRDGRSALRVGMNLQSDLRLHPTDDGLDSTFLVRRARLNLTGTLASFADVRLIADVGQSNTPLFQDAWMELRAAPWLRLRAGRLKVPFGYEWLETSSVFLDFVEQSLLYTLVLPRYDQGLALHGELANQRVEYWLGLFNEASSKARDEDRGKMLAGRLSVSPLEGVSVAVSATHAVGDNLPEEPRGKLATGYAFLTAPQYSVTYATGASGLYVAPADWRLGADAVSFQGPTSLKVEYARFHSSTREGWLQASDVGNDARRVHLPGLRSQAVYASGTWVLTGEKKHERGVEPSSPFDPGDGRYGAGAWEVGLRYGFAQLKFDGLPGHDGPSEERIQELTAGLNWYLNTSTRWMFNASRYRFSQGQPSFDEFLMRIQWSFF